MLPYAKPVGHGKTPEVGSDESESLKGSKGGSDILNHYLNLTKIKDPWRWAVMSNPHSSVLTEPVSLVCGAWTRNDVFSLRHTLIYIVSIWEDLVPNSIPCPISFTDQELKLHGDEMDILEDLGIVIHQLNDDDLIPLGGRVPREYFEKAQAINNNAKSLLAAMEQDEQQKALYIKSWPYQGLRESPE